MIGDEISVTVVHIGSNQVKLGINAGKHVKVHRLEVWKKIKEVEARKAERARVDEEAYGDASE